MKSWTLTNQQSICQRRDRSLTWSKFMQSGFLVEKKWQAEQDKILEDKNNSIDPSEWQVSNFFRLRFHGSSHFMFSFWWLFQKCCCYVIFLVSISRKVNQIRILSPCQGFLHVYNYQHQHNLFSKSLSLIQYYDLNQLRHQYLLPKRL